MQELVSIIIPCFNGAACLPIAIKSAVNQTHTNIEILVADDGSTDGSAEVISLLALENADIRPIFFDENQGVAAARNALISVAKGKYIAFLDSDDLWFPDKLSLQLKAMEDANVSVCHTDYYSSDPSGNRRLVKSRDVVSFRDNCFYNHIGNFTGIYNAEKLGKFFQPSLPHEDYAMWSDILRLSDSIRVPLPLGVYQRSPSSISGNKLRSFSWYWRIQRGYFGFSLLRASMNSVFFVLYQLRKIFSVIS